MENGGPQLFTKEKKKPKLRILKIPQTSFQSRNSSCYNTSPFIHDEGESVSVVV